MTESEPQPQASPEIDCVRCGKQAPAAAQVSWGGALGEQIRAQICQDCWTEWQNAEVMVINELRLNFMDPKSQEVLIQHMKDFLSLGDGSAA